MGVCTSLSPKGSFCDSLRAVLTLSDFPSIESRSWVLTNRGSVNNANLSRCNAIWSRNARGSLRQMEQIGQHRSERVEVDSVAWITEGIDAEGISI